MRKLVLIGLSLAVLSGCAWFRDPPEQHVTTGATVVYSGSKGSEVFSICDKGNLVYLTRTNPTVAIVQGGCNPNLGAPGGPSPLAVGVASDRVNLPALPQPFQVQIVPLPSPPPMVNPLQLQLQSGGESVDPRAPIVIQVQPIPPPTPECPAPPAAKAKAAPKGTKKECP